MAAIPLFRLYQIIRSNNGLSGKGYLHLTPWILKTTAFEPLRWMEDARFRKKINAHVLTEDPVFILGYYRSGTTYLQRMFMQDQSFGYMSIFQSVLPEIMLTGEKSMTPVIDRIFGLLKIQNQFHRIRMRWRNFPGEEDVALTSLLLKEGSQWGMLFPQHSTDYLEKYVLMKNISNADLQLWKKNYLFLLRKLSLANDGRRLVLKSPPNTARIKILLSLFPNAKFIHIIRNPFEVFTSMQRFWTVIKKNYVLGKLRDVNTDDLILDSYDKIMNQYLEEKDFIPPSNKTEITYEEFVRAPVVTMQNIYESLGLTRFENCKHVMNKFATEQNGYSRLQHNVDHETRQMISARWSRYIEYWSAMSKTTLFNFNHSR